MTKLHIGAGADIKDGWINHDILQMDGIDVVHDLSVFPWPFKDNEFDEILMWNVLEHLDNTVRTLEELHRISKSKCTIRISVPYWNSFEFITDPTHKRQFNEFTFQFFDPEHWRCQKRPYYSTARFNIKKLGFRVHFFKPYFAIPRGDFVIYNHIGKSIVGFLASYLSNIVHSMDITLVTKK